MPRRSNEFQELVAAIQRSVSNPGDTVLESVMMKVDGLQTEREIDVLQRTVNGMVDMTVAFEAKDEKRPIDVTEFDSLCAKYRGECRVCVDKFVIVSRSGFTSGAREKAGKLDVLLMTLDEAKDFDWATLGPAHAPLLKMQTARFQMRPQIIKIDIDPPLPLELAAKIMKEGRVKCEHGNDRGHLRCFIHRSPILRKDEAGQKMMHGLTEKCRESPGGAQLLVTMQGGKGRGVTYEGVDYPINEIKVTIQAIDTNLPVTHTPYHLHTSDGKSKVFHQMSTEFGGVKMNMLWPDGLNSKRVVVQVKPKNRQARRSEGKVKVPKMKRRH